MDKLKKWADELRAGVLALDRILRGEATHVAALRDGKVEFPLGAVARLLVVLGMFYGLCMGTFALFNHGGLGQMLASMVKVPALFVLTLAVTLPSLYVFNAMVGSKLTIVSLLRLFVASLGVNLAVLWSLGFIVAFFSINTTTYSFIVLLNVLVFAVAGFLGLGFLLQTLHRISIAPHWSPEDAKVEPKPVELPPVEASEPSLPRDLDAPAADAAPTGFAPTGFSTATSDDMNSPLQPVEGHVLARHTKVVFRCWMVLFGLVGAQMGWVLRPFIGSPDEPFSLFRERQGNFFEAVWRSFLSLFGG